MLRLIAVVAAALAASLAHAFNIPQPQPTVPVVEYYNVYLDHYFLTATFDEVTAIDQGSAGPGWVRTGWSFLAYPGIVPTPIGGPYYCPQNGCGQPVMRFYGKPGGPNSHFYTADPAEAASLEVPQSEWALERVEFRIDVPDGAHQCAAGLTPVYRLYNNGFALHTDGNHRYVTDPGERARMQAKGWIDEGVRFCAYGAALAAVKSYLLAAPLTGKVLPGAQCEDNLGACVAVNNLPTPTTRWTYGFPPDTSPFFNYTGTHSNYIYTSDPASPASGEFVQLDSPVNGSASLFGIHIDSTRRFGGSLSSINPLYQFRTTVQPGAFDDRFFPWTGYESPTELRVSYTLNVKTILSTTPGGGAYGRPTLEFIDTKSSHHFYFTAGTYQTMPLVHGNFLGIDSGTGRVIVGSTLRSDANYFRLFGLGTLATPSGFVAQDPWGYGGYFEFRMNRDEFQRVLDDGRRLDAALSSNPDDYILDNFRFNNEVAGDGEIGINLAGYTLEVWKR
jgi:hypothetical protein